LALSRWFARQITEDRMSPAVGAAVAKALMDLSRRFGSGNNEGEPSVSS
jgi:hypothetical protein